MIQALTTAVQGYNVAAKRMEVAANNVANQFSTARVENGQVVKEPYVPQKVEAVSQESGGVSARVVDKQPAAVTQQTSSGETQQVPNVDTAEELTNTITAKNDAQANLAVMKAVNNTQQSLLDIFV